MTLLLKLLVALFDVVQIIIAIYILIPFLLLSLYIFLKISHTRSPYQKKEIVTSKKFDFAIIITAHQETNMIPPLVDSIEKQIYKNYHVYIVADDCNVQSLNFSSEKIKLLRPENALNSKVKSIQYALSNFSKKHDVVLILDADNLIHPSFLEVMNKYFQKGYKAVQARFKPKNLTTNFAKLDAISDAFNFFIEREARTMIGLSSTIWGSGIAIDYNIYKEVQYSDFLGGFDKKLQSYLVQHVHRIAYAPCAVLYDEKTSTLNSLENQRIRWISSYFKYFKDSFHVLTEGLKKCNFNLFYFGFNILRPPLFIVLELALVITIADKFINISYYHDWIFILSSFLLSFLTILILKGKNMKYFGTIFLLPIFVLKQMTALFKIGKAKKSFLKTEHQHVVYIDSLLEQENNLNHGNSC